MGYHVVNVGEYDLTMGLEFLRELKEQARFTFVSSNLLEKMTRRLPFNAYQIERVNNIRVGIFGLLDPKAAEKDSTIIVKDPFATASEIVKDLHDQTDLVICLSNLGVEENKRLSREVPGITAIVTSGAYRQALQEPIIEKDTMILQASQKGQYLGILEVLAAGSNPESTDRYGYRNAAVELDKKYPEQPEMDAMVKAFKDSHNLPSP